MVIACLAVWCLTHPIHTTLTNVTYDQKTAQVTAMVRAFTADVDQALTKHQRMDVSEYATSAIRFRDEAGQPVPSTWCGSRREGDVVWLCLRAPAPHGASGMTLTDTLLFDVFDDQVNIVMTEHGSVLFTKGDAPRRLP
ncbi:MAG TPA: DUF6702 family protein [Gemmatimonadaceae bacterium]|jgi:hypothetical protein|nr:DUF6702 family protein [Gemmatimonadaceae bacterium]